LGLLTTVKPPALRERHDFSAQGKIIGISGQDSPQGIPEIAVVIQFWFEEENAIPELVIMKKDAFMKFFLVQED
jgi:hypothetical protein